MTDNPPQTTEPAAEYRQFGYGMTIVPPETNSTTQQSVNLPEPYHKGITIDDITYCLEVEGLTITQTALRLNCDKSNITTHLKRNNIIPGYLQKYNDRKARVYSHLQERIVKSVSTDDIKKASLSQKVVALGILADKERTELGLVTEITGYADMVKVNAGIDGKLQAMREKLGIEAEEPAINGDYTETGDNHNETP